MRVLFLTKYTALGPSSRMRTLQYLNYYENAGIRCVVKPLFTDKYLINLYSGKNNTLNILYAFCRRFYDLLFVGKYDLIYIEKEVFPYLPPIAEALFTFIGNKYIVDYDDAIFHNYDLNENFVVRAILKSKIDFVMRNATTVIAGNNYLSDRAKKAGATNVEIIPTTVDMERYDQALSGDKNRIFTVGWIGTLTTYEKHFLLVKNWLIEARIQFGLDVHIIGVSPEMEKRESSFKYIPWSEATEIQLLSNIDIGIMPLLDTPWERGKCAYKLVQYLALGKPVIASDIGVNSELCINGDTGFLANTKEEFLSALSVLYSNKVLREEMGAKGRALVRAKYTIAATIPKLLKIMQGSSSK